MSSNYGPNVSRVLDPTGTQYTNIVWQQGRVPLDSEFSLGLNLAMNVSQRAVLRGTPSGWLGNETNNSEVFLTDPSWSNWFKFGNQQASTELDAVTWAVVNGWLIPVVGTLTGYPPGSFDNSSTWNRITLPPAPSTAGLSRLDFVFLEVWLARIPPSPSPLNKPSSAYVYRFGNVEGGMSFLPDDLVDPSLGIETTERVQLQYRIRVVKGPIGLTNYPDGFDPTAVFAQGGLPTGVTTVPFTNMRDTLGDPGLWRAGDGNGASNPFGSVDGYVYAIPLTGVFRRNSTAWGGNPNANLNGSFDRNPTAIDRTGIKTFSTVATLASDMTADANTFTLVNAANIALPLTPDAPVLIRIGDELLTYKPITGVTGTVVARGGVQGTRAELHRAGAVVSVVSSRPDGLFADQITHTDLIDLRHVVNPNGFNYAALLRYNLDKLLRGSLHSTWKYSGATGVQGTSLTYQDYIGGSSPIGIGITQLDAPDNIRQVFSDVAASQRVTVIANPTASKPGQTIAVPETWSLPLLVTETVPASSAAVSNQFNPDDILTIPILQFKGTVPPADQDQVRFLYDGDSSAVKLHLDGFPGYLPTSYYTVTPTTPGPNDDLTITLTSEFPSSVHQNLYITLHVMYGPGRGLSRRPLALNNVSYYIPGNSTLSQAEQMPANNVQVRVAWAPLWAKYTNAMYKGNLPVTAEAYGDLGSKTVILTPFRAITLPKIATYDGNSIWIPDPRPVPPIATGATAVTSWTAGTWTTSIWCLATEITHVRAGMRLEIPSGDAAGSYAVLADPTSDPAHPGYSRVDLSGPIPPIATPTVGYNVYSLTQCDGLMPLHARDGVTPKWAKTDPLNVFSANGDTTPARKNIYSVLPRELVPSWGEVRVPIRPGDQSPFYEGVNFLFNSSKGTTPPVTESNFVPYVLTGGAATYALFTTWDLTIPFGPAVYNDISTFESYTLAGAKHFDDNPLTGGAIARGLNRHGIQLPPFYGIARLFAVYEAEDFSAPGRGSNYNAYDRTFVANNSTNLLRQNFDGPVFWIEKDADGDCYFILNADALDLSRSPNVIPDFDSGKFVVEASIFGFDRDAFDLDKECRIVLTRERHDCSNSDRKNNLTGWDASNVLSAGTISIIPAPPDNSSITLINYCRTPYQGDPWGSQYLNVDSSYNPGPLTTAAAYSIANSPLDPNVLTRPNQKPLEVLASVGFVTTLGTGRMSGPVDTSNRTMLSNIGAENIWAYPPAAPDSTRPAIVSNVLASDDIGAVATEYLGCTERLPMGSLMRDKDFHGGFAGPYDLHAPMSFTNSSLGNYGVALGQSTTFEGTEIPLDCAAPASGQPGEVLVLVDGTSSYTSTTNFKTYRGGSVFHGNGGHPGGELYCSLGTLGSAGQEPEVLAAKAMLVRNTVTTVGTTEVSAGTELMLLVATTANRLLSGNQPAWVVLGTNGTGEGISAADLYRLEGRPLLRDHAHYNVDPTTIKLSTRFDVQR